MDSIFYKENIVEGNKLIAEFLGYRYIPFNNEEGNQPGWWHIKTPDAIKKLGSPPRKLFKQHYLCRRHTDLKYFNSYDWIMGVIDELESMGYTSSLKTSYVRLNPPKGHSDEFVSLVSFNTDCFICRQYLEILDEFASKDLCSGTDQINKRQAMWLMLVEFVKWYNITEGYYKLPHF